LDCLPHEFVVNIDHHSTTEPFGDINWIDSTAAAVGEMIYNLCKALGVEVTKVDKGRAWGRVPHRRLRCPAKTIPGMTSVIRDTGC
jgi:nanoRNase/pAp phosphatase (c-di-AMP/oligoRNAs hydrolase)